MIVKNVQGTILKTLESLVDRIDFWVIADVGSIDHTKDIVKNFFANRSVPGYLFEDKWENWGHNRSLLMERCEEFKDQFDYIWMVDVEDVLVGIPNIADATADCLTVRCIDPKKQLSFKKPQLFTTSLPWRYRGQFAEEPYCLNGYHFQTEELTGDYIVQTKDIPDPLTTIELFERTERTGGTGGTGGIGGIGGIGGTGGTGGIGGTGGRRIFHVGRCYFEVGDFEKAMDCFLLLEKAGDLEIRYLSNIYLAVSMVSLGSYNLPEVCEVFCDAIDVFPERAEAYFFMGEYLKNSCAYKIAINYLEKAVNLKHPTSVNFIYRDIYRYKLKYLLLICKNHLRRYDECLSLIEDLRDLVKVDQERDFLKRVHNLIHLDISKKPFEGELVPSSNNNDIVMAIKFPNRVEDEPLFYDTLNSFLNSCEDIDKIGRFLCIIDPDLGPKQNPDLGQVFEFMRSPVSHTGFLVYLNPGTIFWKRQPLLNLKEQKILYGSANSGSFLLNTNAKNVPGTVFADGVMVRKPTTGIEYFSNGLSPPSKMPPNDLILEEFKKRPSAIGLTIQGQVKTDVIDPESVSTSFMVYMDRVSVEYEFVKHADFTDYNLSYVGELNDYQMMEICDNTPDVLGFTSSGFLKKKIGDRSTGKISGLNQGFWKKRFVSLPPKIPEKQILLDESKGVVSKDNPEWIFFDGFERCDGDITVILGNIRLTDLQKIVSTKHNVSSYNPITGELRTGRAQKFKLSIGNGIYVRRNQLGPQGPEGQEGLKGSEETEGPKDLEEEGGPKGPEELEEETKETEEEERVYKVKPICFWDYSDNLAGVLKKFSKDGEGRWGRFELTGEDSEADYFVILGKPWDKNEYFVADRTIVLQMEPFRYNKPGDFGTKSWGFWAKPDKSKFLMVDDRSESHGMIDWHIGFDYPTLLTTRFQDRKDPTKLLSTVVSNKRFATGHILRLDFIRFLDAKMEFDIYGRCSDQGFRNYRGELNPHKDDGILPYRYSIAIENTKEHNYLTEKLVDCILGETVAFYWGCPNIAEHYPGTYIWLPIDEPNGFERSLEIIRKTIHEDDPYESMLPKLLEAKNRILQGPNTLFAKIQKAVSMGPALV